jgi:putative peptidoglycan lipid II flippase
VSFIAPGFSPEIHLTTVHLLRIMLPGFFFLLLSDLLIAILHSFRIFGIPAATRVIPPAVTLACVLLLAPRYGVTTLAIGTLLGATINMALLCIALIRAGYVYEPVFSLRDPDVRRVIRLVAPFVLSVLAAQGAGIIYRMIVSHFPEGSLSALKFGEKIFQVTNTLFLGSITTIAFPAFSRAVAARAWDEVRSTMRQAIRVMAFFGVPLMISIALLRTPLVRLLYERGSFTPEDTAATAAVLGLFLIGLIANGVSSLLGHLALALKVTRTSVLVTIGAQICSIAMFMLFAPRMGIRGLALASALGPFVLTLLYLIALRPRITGLVRSVFNPGLFSFATSGAALAVTLMLVKRFLPLPESSRSADELLVIVSAILGSLTYLLLSKLLKIPEVRNAEEIVYYALRRRRS